MSEIDYIRERERGAGEPQDAAAFPQDAAETGTPAERKWPLAVSLLIAAMVSLTLWAGIIIFAIRLWRWM